MATYSNQHWLLCHIRNSFISTDDTGMCETVMLSDDLPKHYLRKFQQPTNTTGGSQTNHQQQHKSTGSNGGSASAGTVKTPALSEVDFMCYPGLDQSDDEDLDISTQSFDIQMYPEVGAHRFRSNTAQKLEKMEVARRKAARTRSVNFDDDIVPPERPDFFERKQIRPPTRFVDDDELESGGAAAAKGVVGVKSKLALQLANTPKQAQNRFIEYARFDGTSQTGIQTKRINVFLSMLPERERNYPIKICVLSSAKIIEVIGLVCYKATIQFPDIPLKSIRYYGLYMTEDNDDLEDFPPLDNREPCSKFGFSHLTLAERRPLVPVTRVDFHNYPTKSMTSEEDKARLAATAVRSLQNIELNGGEAADDDELSDTDAKEETIKDYDERMMSHDDMLEAPLYRTYRLNIIDKRFFKTEITLGISGERMEINQHKVPKFWTKQKAVTYPIDAIAYCEIVERRHVKATLRIWLKSSSSSASSGSGSGGGGSGDVKSSGAGGTSSNGAGTHSPTSPSHFSSPFSFFSGSSSLGGGQQQQHHHIRFKHYDFDTDLPTAEHIVKKLNCILKVRSSEVRREFLQLRERKLEKSHAKKQLKM